MYMEWDLPVTDQAKVKPNMSDMDNNNNTLFHEGYLYIITLGYST